MNSTRPRDPAGLNPHDLVKVALEIFFRDSPGEQDVAAIQTWFTRHWYRGPYPEPIQDTEPLVTMTHLISTWWREKDRRVDQVAEKYRVDSGEIAQVVDCRLAKRLLESGAPLSMMLVQQLAHSAAREEVRDRKLLGKRKAVNGGLARDTVGWRGGSMGGHDVVDQPDLNRVDLDEAAARFLDWCEVWPRRCRELLNRIPWGKSKDRRTTLLLEMRLSLLEEFSPDVDLPAELRELSPSQDSFTLPRSPLEFVEHQIPWQSQESGELVCPNWPLGKTWRLIAQALRSSHKLLVGSRWLDHLAEQGFSISRSSWRKRRHRMRSAALIYLTETELDVLLRPRSCLYQFIVGDPRQPIGGLGESSGENR